MPARQGRQCSRHCCASMPSKGGEHGLASMPALCSRCLRHRFFVIPVCPSWNLKDRRRCCNLYVQITT
ncbi:hypothetical protein DUNSADRAFT_6822 [Dunaliella salina]|uniref:Encoded protein n=1 Tax=Dunaliella salina TaxID=3046 RepID=A0ABQ7GMK6_DUNSA|nr:hypothetical protein DUNSADRAFT_6822 [Dunaliella salina]|eukprot:KAF5835836.1 hypothetical protein DUNSADRAFT_6822 [Dunaliella salina]